MDVWVRPNEEVLKLCAAILSVYSECALEEGLRENRAKARLMWLIDKWGMNRFRIEVEKKTRTILTICRPER